MSGKFQGVLKVRVYWLMAGFLLWGGLLGYRLFALQVVQHAELEERAQRQRSRSFEISPQRGTIYDRNHHELAISIQVDSIFAVPSEISDKPRVAARLAPLLGMSSPELLQKLSSAKGFTWLKRKADATTAARVKNLDLAGIYFEKESQRFYPKRELAAHVLGYVGVDNEGLSGVEYYYDKRIKGEHGRMLLMADAKQRSFSSAEKPPVPGQDLVLTIDEYVQFVVEQELAAQVAKSQARSGTAIVMDPKTGEILAMASVPTYNPNQFRDFPSENLTNRSIWMVYEPGSTFKVVTASAVLNEKLASPDEIINCNNGSITIGKYRIRDHTPYGNLKVSEVVSHSSNVGAAKLGLRLDREKFAQYIRNFGFGLPTGVDLPREENGLVRDWRQWPMIMHANISMGQGIGVTPLQILKAVSILANGGYVVQPHLVMQEESGPLQKASFQTAPTASQQIVRTQTTQMLKGMMTDVVTEGTGKSARLEGFTAAGKTGTAQKVEHGVYSHSKFIASFAGFAPLQSPVIAIVVAIDEPKGQYYGGEVAAPVFRSIAEKTLRYLSIAPDQPLTPAQWTQLRKHEAEEAASDPDMMLEPLVRELTSPAKDSTALGPAESMPPPVETQAAAPAAEVDPDGFPGIEVPDLAGKSMRAALTELSGLGLGAQALGSGMAVMQTPLAHARVPRGTKVMIQFSRRGN